MDGINQTESCSCPDRTTVRIVEMPWQEDINQAHEHYFDRDGVAEIHHRYDDVQQGSKP